MVKNVSLQRDVDILGLLVDDAVVSAVESKKSTSICVIFGDAQEANQEQFARLKEFATDNGYDFNEDTDFGQNRKMHFYILTVGDTPF